jgi:hypothetical protein
MQTMLRNLAFEVLAKGHAFPTTQTARADIERLIGHLQPMAVSLPLVRLGPNGDGGYLVPDDLVGIEACFSPGVAQVSGFELDCAQRGMKVFMADRSVDRPADSHELFHFLKRYVGAVSNEDFMTVDDWVSDAPLEATSDLMLQIDIEGFEYQTFLAMSNHLMRRFRIIVGEFHQLNQLWNGPYFTLVSAAFEKILQTHTCVHVHPNNEFEVFDRWGLAIPPLTEITFLRKDRVHDARAAQLFPHPLDADNTNNPHYALPRQWYATLT